MSRQRIAVPDIGGAESAEVVEVLVAVGDAVSEDQGLVVLESDKASMEVPAPVAGVVVELAASEGAQVAEGDSIAVIEVEDAGAGEGDAAAAPDDPSGERDDGERAGPGTGQSPAPQPAAQAAGETLSVAVPDVGSDDGVDLVEIAVAVGDTVAAGDTLLILESDKASVEVPAPVAGVVRALLVEEGQRVREGDRLLELESAPAGAAAPAPGGAGDAAQAPPQGEAPSPPVSGAAAPAPAAGAAPPQRGAASRTAPAPDEDAPIYAGPAVRRLAREFGIPLQQLRGTGPRGRILKEDLHAFNQRALAAPAADAAATLPSVPEVDFAQFGPVDVVERSRIDRATADNMRRSWLNAPQVTQFDDADISELDAFRRSLRDDGERRGVKMTLLPFLLKACAVALRRHERLNASLSDGGATLTLKRYVHIGVAVDTPAGLLVPVLRDVDRKSLWELAAEVAELAAAARERRLQPAQMQGAGFTVSSLGAVGGRGFTPIVNTPEVAILGVGRAATLPHWDGTAFQPRLLLPLALSYDHRVVNGGDGGRFLSELCELLGDLRRLLL